MCSDHSVQFSVCVCVKDKALSISIQEKWKIQKEKDDRELQINKWINELMNAYMFTEKVKRNWNAVLDWVKEERNGIVTPNHKNLVVTVGLGFEFYMIHRDEGHGNIEMFLWKSNAVYNIQQKHTRNWYKVYMVIYL